MATSSAFELWRSLHERPRAGRTLVVGSRVYRGRTDRRAAFADALGVDMLDGPGVDVVHDLEQPAPQLGQFDHVECISVLEHARRPWLLAANLQQMMVAGATLLLSVPYIWRVHGYPQDYWRFTADGVRQLFDGIEWQSLTYATRHDLDVDFSRQGRLDSKKQPWFRGAEVYGWGART